jgi:hypothetical protein
MGKRLPQVNHGRPLILECGDLSRLWTNLLRRRALAGVAATRKRR